MSAYSTEPLGIRRQQAVRTGGGLQGGAAQLAQALYGSGGGGDALASMVRQQNRTRGLANPAHGHARTDTRPQDSTFDQLLQVELSNLIGHGKSGGMQIGPNGDRTDPRLTTQGRAQFNRMGQAAQQQAQQQQAFQQSQQRSDFNRLHQDPFTALQMRVR